VYVPETDSVLVSMKPPFLPIAVGATRFVPSGRTIETYMLEVSDVPMVTSLTSRLMRWPAVPLNVAVAFSFATVVVTVTGGPPGVMV
jgi:hypothetical protein